MSAGRLAQQGQLTVALCRFQQGEIEEAAMTASIVATGSPS